MRLTAWMLPVKVAAASVGVVATAVVVLALAPAAAGFLAAEVPRAYFSLLRWLSPPYLYFVINGIIISIAASSRFQKVTSSVDDDQVMVPSRPPEFATPVMVRPEIAPPPAAQADVPPEAGEAKTEEEEEFVISRSKWEPRKRVRETAAEEEELVISATDAAAVGEEKPLVSERFSHRRDVKLSPEGKALGVARSKRQGTFENTWRTITDGRAVPLARHLKKSDTWDVRHHSPRTDIAGATVTTASPPQPMRKSETFCCGREQRRVAAPAGGVDWAGRSEPESGGVHQEVQRGDAATAPGVPPHDQSWRALIPMHEYHSHEEAKKKTTFGFSNI